MFDHCDLDCAEFDWFKRAHYPRLAAASILWRAARCTLPCWLAVIRRNVKSVSPADSKSLPRSRLRAMPPNCSIRPSRR